MANVNMPPASEMADNYKNSTSRVPERYRKGVERAKDWQNKAIAGQALYETQMTDTSVLKRREAGIQKVSDEAWRSAAATKGSARIVDGMRAAVPKYQAGVEPIRARLDGLNIPERVADANANIDNRLKPVVQAMQEAAGKR